MVLHVAVCVPVVVRAGVDQLDDADAPLDQPAGDQALIAERGRVAWCDSVGRSRVAGVSRRDVEHFGCLAHHAPGDVECRDPRAEVGVIGVPAAWRSFTSRSMICSSSSSVTDRSGGRRSGIGSGPERSALPDGSAAGNCCPRPDCRRTACARRAPCTTAAIRLNVPSPKLSQAPSDGIGTVAEPVCIASTAWKCSTMSVCRLRITHRSSASVPRCGNSSLIHQARLAALAEAKRRAQERALGRFVAAQAERRNRLAVMLVERRLVVERIDVRKAAGQEDHDQVAGLSPHGGPAAEPAGPPPFSLGRLARASGGCLSRAVRPP